MQSPTPETRQKVSAVVISYNRADTIRTCLTALAFADELIVVDKSSTDGTDKIAAEIADKVYRTPWSPVVEETRAFAVGRCAYDWIICVDDDECLSIEAIRFIQKELLAPRADIYFLPQRHYICGIHDEAAYYWPDEQARFLHRGAVEFTPTVHGGTKFLSDRIYRVPADDGICIHHLSHRNVHQWIEKTNRYTSQPDRLSPEQSTLPLATLAHQAIDEWQAKAKNSGDYPLAMSLLRATYDIIDRLKSWEAAAGLGTAELLQLRCEELELAYASEYTGSPLAASRLSTNRERELPIAAAMQTDAKAPGDESALRDVLRHTKDVVDLLDRNARENVEHLRALRESELLHHQIRENALRNELADSVERRTAEEAQANTALSLAKAEHASALHRAAELQARYAALEASLLAHQHSISWRLTAPMRDFSRRYPGVAGRLRRFSAEHPSIRRNVARVVRVAKRVIKGEPMRARPSAAQPHSLGDAVHQHSPVTWFYVGDTIEWLAHHRHLTGVGRVSTTLFASNVATPSSAMPACTNGNSPTGLVAVESSHIQAVQTSSLSRDGERFLESLRRAPASSAMPSRGDHVLFSGAIWGPSYSAMFEKLHAEGISFSVLINDIIPVESPELVGTEYEQMFRNWLGVTVALADRIFVSSRFVEDQISRWAIASGVERPMRISRIKFGGDEIAQSTPTRSGLESLAKVDLSNFVLCVGTIDKRKNQQLMCRAWAALASDLDASQLPQLLFVGRGDLNIAVLTPEISSLVAQNKILTLSDLEDESLAYLYDHCLFTVFPSTSEGYGLPVSESLKHRKLCISAALDPVVEHAGDLPWYFPSNDLEAACRLIKQAIIDPGARATAEAYIARAYEPATWNSTMASVADVLRSSKPWTVMRASSGDFPIPISTPTAEILANARQWCTSNAPDVSILVINWNAASLTRACLRHIWALTTDVRYEVIIVDNGSSTVDLSLLNSLGDGVKLIPLGVNRFFGEANNIAAEAASGRYLCLLNNDAFGSEGWLGGLVTAIQKWPNAGGVGPMFLFPDGSVQEAGASMNPDGYPKRMGRGETTIGDELLKPRVVDYISAATLLIEKNTFVSIGGFDLTYEPAYYEDADLCFKLAAVGKPIIYCPEVRVTHIEGASGNSSAASIARRNALGDLNRDKFTGRWGKYLNDRSAENLALVAKSFWHSESLSSEVSTIEPGSRPRAFVYTPFALTPGGGERYLLSMTAALAKTHDVTLGTMHPYSRMRLLSLAHEFEIDLTRCQLVTYEALAKLPAADLMVTLGNHIVPPAAAQAKRNLYICQFPFPLPNDMKANGRSLIESYDEFIAYSNYAKAHIFSSLSANQFPEKPITVLYPPVATLQGDPEKKKNIVLSVGRFFTGGHNKRHDLMIETFATVARLMRGEVELHLAGSSIPDPTQMDYLAKLKEMARGLPVVFHVNAAPEKLSALYSEAAIYWHAAGMDSDLVARPETAEHFGISLVEAMSAGCVSMAFNSGGPREIVQDGVSGMLYSSREELAARTVGLLHPSALERRIKLGMAAKLRASYFSHDAFEARLAQLIGQGEVENDGTTSARVLAVVKQ